MRTEDIVSDEEMGKVFAFANFGTMTQREVLKSAVMKCAGRYRSGHTATQIIKELGLCGKNGLLTKKGGRYLYAAWHNGPSV